MREGFKKAGTIYKYITILLTIIYWIGVVIDDWVFIEKYWAEHWIDYIGIWLIWFLMYLLVFSLYYWITATSVVLIYYKLIRKVRKNN